MLKSMTGFGKQSCEYLQKKITVEIKSLNSKSCDLNIKLPQIYKEKEIEIRNELYKTLERGKIDLMITIDSREADRNTLINAQAVKDYFTEFNAIADQMNVTISPDQLFQLVMRMPDTMKTEQQEIDENEWIAIFDALKNAVKQLDGFREQEGKVLHNDIVGRITSIQNKVKLVEEYEPERMITVKTRLTSAFEDYNKKNNADTNRFEQELIYYLEKLDITEEKVRLTNHCNYFLATCKEKNPGKKLGFISQEIGREINTIGSKADHAQIQKIVVEMKDELEKVKEQLMNVL